MVLSHFNQFGRHGSHPLKLSEIFRESQAMEGSSESIPDAVTKCEKVSFSSWSLILSLYTLHEHHGQVCHAPSERSPASTRSWPSWLCGSASAHSTTKPSYQQLVRKFFGSHWSKVGCLNCPIRTGLSQVTTPSELIEMVQYWSLLLMKTPAHMGQTLPGLSPVGDIRPEVYLYAYFDDKRWKVQTNAGVSAQLKLEMMQVDCPYMLE